MNKKYKASRHYLMVGIFLFKKGMRGERVSRRRHKRLNEYTCCEQCSKSVAADGTYTCNNKTVIENYMPAEDYFWCDGEMFIRREYERFNQQGTAYKQAK